MQPPSYDTRSERDDMEATPRWRSGSDRPRVGFLAIGRKRRGFDMEWGRQIEEAAWKAVGELDLDAFRPQAPVVGDASLRRALEELRQAGCDALVVLQPTMGDGRLAPILAQLWGDPLVLWATPERPDGGKVSSCSLVGTHVFASILRQLGRPFEITYGHPDDAKTRRQLRRAVQLTAAAARLRRAKVGLVGSHAPGFINMHADPALMSRELGVQLHHFGLQEFYDLVEGQTDQAVRDDIERVAAMGLPFGDGVSEEDLPASSRYYLAMRALREGESLDALAVRCWPELPNRFGQWPYLAMARLACEGEAVALEGDVDGAISSLIGRLLGVGPGYLSDWLEHDEHSITLWHPGHAPLDFCTPGTARLGRHFNSGHPVVIDAELAADRPITLFRVWRCDGAYRAMACDARTVPPRRELSGAHGLAVVDDRDVCRWFDALCHEGMPHHVSVLPGHQAELVRRLARLLEVRWVASEGV